MVEIIYSASCIVTVLYAILVNNERLSILYIKNWLERWVIPFIRIQASTLNIDELHWKVGNIRGRVNEGLIVRIRCF